MKFKEKLKNMFTGSKKKENLIALLIILIVTAIAINYILTDENTKENNKSNSNNKISNNIREVVKSDNDDSDYYTNLEEKLANILSDIDGVTGDVKVLITYSQSSEILPLYDENSKQSNTTESDSNGGSRQVSEINNEKQIIYEEKSDGTKEPITKSTLSPKIEGAIIIAKGASNANVKSNIVDAVEAATGLLPHKIQVFEMKENN